MTHTADDMHDDSPVSHPMTTDSKALEAACKAYARRWMPSDNQEFTQQARQHVEYIIAAYLNALPSQKVEGEPVRYEIIDHTGCIHYANDAEHAEKLRQTLVHSSPVLAEGVTGWQPIETAPKDGTWISLWRGASQTGTWSPLIIARWYAFSDDDASWVWPDNAYDVFTGKGREAAEEKISNGDLYEDARNFTHWQPLPTPPAVTP